MENPVLLIAVSLLLTWVQVMSDNGPNCRHIYQRFSTSHSYCQPKNPSCNRLQSNLAKREMLQVVDLHNFYRSVIANQQKQSNGLPPAADMLEMEWDSELAEIAQRHSDQCKFAHDEGDQRRVRNFGVGQNIAEQRNSGNLEPQPDWPWAIGAFFGEIKNFRSDMICGSRNLQPGQGEIGHFTQVIWSRSFRIGCGYTLYKDGNTYVRLYVCNYGPGGNVGGACVYKKGPACSRCPLNTKCVTGSPYFSEYTRYPGLCTGEYDGPRSTNDRGPYLPLKEPHFFNCDFRNFRNSTDCQIQGGWHFKFSGLPRYYISPALSGDYLEAILAPGQNFTIVFSKRLTPNPGAKSMCVQVRYRKGPDLAKDSLNNVAKSSYIIPSLNNWTADFKFPDLDGGFRQQFTSYSMGLLWTSATEMKISFEVPNGAAQQFLNLKSIIGFPDKCKNVEE